MKSRQKYPIVEDEIDQIFYEYVSSNEFCQMDVKSEQFRLKLNTSITNFATEIDMFDWISNNLSKTKFTSLNDAINQWTRYSDSYVVLQNKFPKMKSFLLTANLDLVAVKYDKWFSNVIVFGDYPTCEQTFKNCRSAASQTYAEKAIAIQKETAETGSYDGFRHEKNSKEYKDAVDACINAYKECYGVQS